MLTTTTALLATSLTCASKHHLLLCGGCGSVYSLPRKHLEFSEESRYTLNLDDSRDSNCILVHDNMVFAYITYLRTYIHTAAMAILASLSLSLSLSPAILYASVVILGLALLWVGGKIVWLFLRGKGFFHYLHLKRVDRVTARVGPHTHTHTHPHTHTHTHTHTHRIWATQGR